MHPILGDRRKLALYLAAWLLIGVFLSLSLRGNASWPAAAAFWLPLSLIYSFAALSTWYVCRVFPIGASPRTSNLVAVHAVGGALAAAAWAGAAALWAEALERLGAAGAQALVASEQWLLFVVAALLFWLAALFHYLLMAFEASREADTRAIQLNLLAREAELKALRAQIDPHFIFNSLHSISALAGTDPEAARRMCLLLADFLRETLRLGSSRQIPLADELALAERFLAIEQVRLGARLRVARETDPQAMSCLVPPLLLQPLVENAVVHGVAQLVEGGTIRVAARRAGSLVTISLENPCDPDRAGARGAGLGLDLLRRRLAMHFGMADALKAVEESGSFRVEVRIPAVTAA